MNKSDLLHHVGTTSFYRGLAYFHNGKVLSINQIESYITGSVQGSARKPYSAMITLAPDNGKLESQCSCPISIACKHVAALGLAALQRYAGGIGKTLDLTAPVNQSPTWKTQLAPLLQNLAQPSNPQAQLRLFLQFDDQLKIRPQVFYPTSQESSLTNILWSNIQYLSTDTTYLGLPAQHILFFQQLLSVLSENVWSSQKWLTITKENSAAFWQVIQHSASYNVTLITGKRNEIVKISSEKVQCTITIEDVNDDIILRTNFVLRNQELATEKIFLLDKNLHFIVIKDASALYFYPIHSSATERPVLFTEPIRIPKTDVADFQTTIAPQLLQHTRVRNQSKNITLPTQGSCANIIVTIQPKKPKSSQAIRIQVTFNYEGKVIPAYDTEQIIQTSRQTIIRDSAQEQLLLEKLNHLCVLDTQPLLSPDTATTILSNITAARFIHEIVPTLQQQTWATVVLSEHLPTYTKLEASPAVELEVKEQPNQIDWFDLAVTIVVEGETIPFQAIFEALAQHQTYLLLDNGNYISLDQPQFEQLRTLLAEAQRLRANKTTNTISVSRYHVSLWEDLKKLGVVKAQTERWQRTMKGLTAPKIKRYATTRQCSATLRPYQLEGYSWLRFLYHHELGGILADDMGLGKTIQAIALMCAVKKTSGAPFLIIAPTSVVENWDMELERFAPKLKRVILRRGDRSAHFAAMKQADVIVTSYALVLRDETELLRHTFDTIILDEAQFVKNHQSKIYATIRKIQSQRRFALTGTPMENSLMDLWSVYSIVAPGLFGTPQEFREQYQTPIEKRNDATKLQQLQRRMRPFLLRRAKTVVEQELPPKTEQTMLVDLHPKHRKLYDVHLQKERKKVLQLLSESGGLQKHRFVILQSLTHLRLLALHPALITTNKQSSIPSTKLETVLETIQTVTAEKHRVLVFSQFTSYLALVRTALDKQHLNYLYLDGATKNRKELVQQFQQSPDSPAIFLISLKAGGVGLNLTAADYCIMLDPWWNPAVEQQAIDRTHRIGQTKHVMVYKCIAKNTIEEKVLALQAKKKQLFQNVLNNTTAQFSSVLSDKDIRDLLIG